MAEETPTSNETNSNAPQFAIDRIFVKDVSLETPKGINAFGAKWKPRVDLDINTSQNKVTDELTEVVLRLTITVKDQESEEIYYLIEINQAGVFHAKGFPAADLRRVLATAAPNALFPYARETVDSMVVKAGFPPLRLAPINFDALFQAAVRKQQSEQKETVQ